MTGGPAGRSSQERVLLHEVCGASLLPASGVAQVFGLPPLSGSGTASAPGQGQSVLPSLLCKDCGSGVCGDPGSKYTRVRSLGWRLAVWQAQDPIRAGITGLGTGSGVGSLAGPVVLASSLPHLLLLRIPVTGTPEACKWWSGSPLRPLPSVQLEVGFGAHPGVFLDTVLHGNTAWGGPMAQGQLCRNSTVRVRATVVVLWSLQFTLTRDPKRGT